MKQLFIIMSFPVMLFAQGPKKNVEQGTGGIKFEEGGNWKGIQKIATDSNKYIFVDCYATWCGPCKQMDRDVFKNGDVGDYVNSKFISLRIQMDTSKSDNRRTKEWYAEARDIRKKYSVTEFPTYLFFSPEGKILHRAVGSMSDADFIELAGEALDTTKQYYTLLNAYHKGRRDYSEMIYLAGMVSTLGNHKLANEIATNCKEQYLDKLSSSELCRREYIEFIGKFPHLINSNGGFFNLYYYHADSVDSIMDWKGYADFYVRGVIKREEIDTKLWKGGKPVTENVNWDVIAAMIKDKYGDRYAKSLVLPAKVAFYKSTGNWRKYFNTVKHIMDQYPPKANGQEFAIAIGSLVKEDVWGLNTEAWFIFENCEDKRFLEEALRWSELSIRLDEGRHRHGNVQFLDTKANLLYKLGRVEEAISWEKKAIEAGIIQARNRGESNKGDFFDEFTNTVEKMKKAEQTWPIRKRPSE